MISYECFITTSLVSSPLKLSFSSSSTILSSWCITGRSVYHWVINFGLSAFFGLFQLPRDISASLIEICFVDQKLGPAIDFLTSSTLAIVYKKSVNLYSSVSVLSPYQDLIGMPFSG